MSVVAGLFERLSEDKKLVALLANENSIYLHFAPQEAKTPYVLIDLHVGKKEWSFRNFYRDQLWRVEGIVRGGNAIPAEEINARCEELLDDYSLNIGEHLIYLRGEIEVDWGEIDGGTLVNHKGMLYRIYSEPSP